MIPANVSIYTPNGWKKYGDLFVGDTVISYDEQKNVCVYDKISAIETDFIWKRKLIMINKLNMRYAMTDDHELIVTNKNKQITRQKVKDVFMRTITGNNAIVAARPLNFYDITKDEEEIKWSARIASLCAIHKYYLGDRAKVLEAINGISGYESLIWLDTFFHWNILQRDVNYAKSIVLSNRDVKNMVYETAIKSGNCVFYAPNIYNKITGGWRMRLIRSNSLQLITSNWAMKEYEGIMYNLTNKNGSFVALANGGTTLISCNKE